MKTVDVVRMTGRFPPLCGCARGGAGRRGRMRIDRRGAPRRRDAGAHHRQRGRPAPLGRLGRRRRAAPHPAPRQRQPDCSQRRPRRDRRRARHRRGRFGGRRSAQIPGRRSAACADLRDQRRDGRANGERHLADPGVHRGQAPDRRLPRARRRPAARAAGRSSGASRPSPAARPTSPRWGPTARSTP